MASFRARGGREKSGHRVSCARWAGLSDARLSMGIRRHEACGVA
jgi:hypothetical protein